MQQTRALSSNSDTSQQTITDLATAIQSGNHISAANLLLSDGGQALTGSVIISLIDSISEDDSHMLWLFLDRLIQVYEKEMAMDLEATDHAAAIECVNECGVIFHGHIKYLNQAIPRLEKSKQKIGLYRAKQAYNQYCEQFAAKITRFILAKLSILHTDLCQLLTASLDEYVKITDLMARIKSAHQQIANYTVCFQKNVSIIGENPYIGKLPENTEFTNYCEEIAGTTSHVVVAVLKVMQNNFQSCLVELIPTDSNFTTELTNLIKCLITPWKSVIDAMPQQSFYCGITQAAFDAYCDESIYLISTRIGTQFTQEFSALEATFFDQGTPTKTLREILGLISEFQSKFIDATRVIQPLVTEIAALRYSKKPSLFALAMDQQLADMLSKSIATIMSALKPHPDLLALIAQIDSCQLQEVSRQIKLIDENADNVLAPCLKFTFKVENTALCKYDLILLHRKMDHYCEFVVSEVTEKLLANLCQNRDVIASSVAVQQLRENVLSVIANVSELRKLFDKLKKYQTVTSVELVKQKAQEISLECLRIAGKINKEQQAKLRREIGNELQGIREKPDAILSSIIKRLHNMRDTIVVSVESIQMLVAQLQDKKEMILPDLDWFRANVLLDIVKAILDKLAAANQTQQSEFKGEIADCYNMLFAICNYRPSDVLLRNCVIEVIMTQHALPLIKLSGPENFFACIPKEFGEIATPYYSEIVKQYLYQFRDLARGNENFWQNCKTIVPFLYEQAYKFGFLSEIHGIILTIFSFCENHDITRDILADLLIRIHTATRKEFMEDTKKMYISYIQGMYYFIFARNCEEKMQVQEVQRLVVFLKELHNLCKKSKLFADDNCLMAQETHNVLAEIIFLILQNKNYFAIAFDLIKCVPSLISHPKIAKLEFPAATRGIILPILRGYILDPSAFLADISLASKEQQSIGDFLYSSYIYNLCLSARDETTIAGLKKYCKSLCEIFDLAKKKELDLIGCRIEIYQILASIVSKNIKDQDAWESMFNVMECYSALLNDPGLVDSIASTLQNSTVFLDRVLMQKPQLIHLQQISNLSLLPQTRDESLKILLKFIKKEHLELIDNGILESIYFLYVNNLCNKIIAVEYKLNIVDFENLIAAIQDAEQKGFQSCGYAISLPPSFMHVIKIFAININQKNIESLMFLLQHVTSELTNHANHDVALSIIKIYLMNILNDVQGCVYKTGFSFLSKKLIDDSTAGQMLKFINSTIPTTNSMPLLIDKLRVLLLQVKDAFDDNKDAMVHFKKMLAVYHRLKSMWPDNIEEAADVIGYRQKQRDDVAAAARVSSADSRDSTAMIQKARAYFSITGAAQP